jgi:hypothetical protein
VKIDEIVVETPTVATYDENHHTEIGSSGVWETNHYVEGSESIIKLIAENIDKEIKVRFVGREYYKDIILSKKDKIAIKESFELAQILEEIAQIKMLLELVNSL